MDAVILLWDAADLWGLLAWQALKAFGVPCRLVKGENIAHTLQSDKPRLLMVPGGPARRKFEALGPAGVAAVRAFVHNGGHYLGVCGGAGLGLSGEAGLGLCPWGRAGFTDRLQHLISGHVTVQFGAHHLAPQAEPLQPSLHASSSGLSPASSLGLSPGLSSGLSPAFSPGLASPALLPVWWPGRFATGSPSSTSADAFFTDSQAGSEPVVLARYAGPGPDLHMVDLPLAQLPEAVRRKWHEVYGVCLTPETLEGAPCVVHGAFGRGTCTLSYSHLETPDSPVANAWLAHLLRELGGVWPVTDTLPPWHPVNAPIRWDAMAPWCAQIDALMDLGRLHGLLFDRAPWLTGWKNGVPGAGLNNLYLALHTLASLEPAPRVLAHWQLRAHHFAKTFNLFYHGAEELLLARRLAATLPDAVPSHMLTAQRHALFGSAMHGGGLYQELMDDLNELLFLSWS